MAPKPSKANDKRNHSEVERSPTGTSPPTSRVRSDDNFTQKLLTALQDTRVSELLTGLLLEPLAEELKTKNKTIDALEQEVQQLKKQVRHLENAADETEQYSRRNALRIWCKTPEKKDEDTDGLVMEHVRKMGVKLDRQEIGRSHRVGKPTTGKSRPIIVKFISYRVRERVYQARKQSTDVYISEDLTQTRSRLLYMARLERRAQRFKHCWSSDGRIKIRLHNNSVHSITTQEELDKLIDDTPLPGQ